MDDWVVLTKSKPVLRKVVKHTHAVLELLKFRLHPRKTYIGKISHGFNFLAYYFDNQKILPSKEVVKRFQERFLVLYERPPHKTLPRRYHKSRSDRDISDYQVNEEAPSDAYFTTFFASLTLTLESPEVLKRLRGYLTKWARWLKLGLSAITEFSTSVETFLPSLFSCMDSGKLPCAALSHD